MSDVGIGVFTERRVVLENVHGLLTHSPFGLEQ